MAVFEYVGDLNPSCFCKSAVYCLPHTTESQNHRPTRLENTLEIVRSKERTRWENFQYQLSVTVADYTCKALNIANYFYYFFLFLLGIAYEQL